MYSEDIQQQQSIVPQLEVNKIPEVEKSSDQLETHSNQNQHGKRTCSKSIFYNKENVPKKCSLHGIEIRIIIHIVLLFVCIETFKKFQCTEGAYSMYIAQKSCKKY